MSGGEMVDFTALHVCTVTNGKDYMIQVGDKEYYFEWSEMFGPLFVSVRGRGIDNSRIRRTVWRAVTLWKRQGMRTSPLDMHLRAIWDEPPAGTYFRLGRMIIEAVEPPGFDDDFSPITFVDVPLEPRP